MRSAAPIQPLAALSRRQRLLTAIHHPCMQLLVRHLGELAAACAQGSEARQRAFVRALGVHGSPALLQHALGGAWAELATTLCAEGARLANADEMGSGADGTDSGPDGAGGAESEQREGDRLKRRREADGPDAERDKKGRA